MLLLTVSVLSFGVAEVVVRSVGEFDSAGNFVFHNRIIRPHNLPVSQVEQSVRQLQASEQSVVVYHQYLGWAPRPGAESRNGLYRYNSQGVRSPVEFSTQPDSGVLRIALFGDSFTHSDDVPYEDSLGAQLEKGLRAAGIRAEVLNFGVGGYGLDQAMLRYAVQGKAFAPDVVVMGFQPENLKRNLNLLRPLYDPRTRLPFAKSRFIFEGDGISLINVPVLPPEQVAETLRDLEHWPLLPHEHFYDPAAYQGAWWRHSKMLATMVDMQVKQDDPWVLKRILYRDGSDDQKLGWAVIQAFAQEVAANGAEFKIVHLPTPVEMDVQRRLGRWPYQVFLDALDDSYDVVHPEQELLAAVEKDGLSAMFEGHYTAAGNRIIAEHLQAEIINRH